MTASDNKTPWFKPPKRQPVRRGWYEVRCRHGMFGKLLGQYDRLYWTGTKWVIDRGDRDACSFGLPCDAWRGLLRGTAK